MLPFDLPQVTRGFAEVGSGLGAVGEAASAAVSAELSARLGLAVAVTGRPLPGRSEAVRGARLAFDLAALPGTAALDLDAALMARLADRLAGGTGDVSAAATLTPLEASVLELLALVALEGLSRQESVERALSPRLCRDHGEPASALAVALDLDLGGLRGRGRLLLPPQAVRALRGPAQLSEAAGSVALPASLRSGACALPPEELAALSAGDVLLLDAGPGGRGDLVLAGGYRLSGRLADDSLLVEEMHMTEHAEVVPVTLEVELARVTVTLADLARLEPGAALPLQMGRRGLVTLRVGERAVARGELVEIDGAVGVRVLSLGDSP